MTVMTDRHLFIALSNARLRDEELRSELLILDRSTGQIVQEIVLKQRQILDLAVVGNTLCVATVDALYCFSGLAPGD